MNRPASSRPVVRARGIAPALPHVRAALAVVATAAGLSACGTQPPATTQSGAASGLVNAGGDELRCEARSTDAAGTVAVWRVTSKSADLAGDVELSVGREGASPTVLTLMRLSGAYGSPASAPKPTWTGPVDVPGVHSGAGRVELHADASPPAARFVRYDGQVLSIPCASVPSAGSSAGQDAGRDTAAR